MKGYDSIIEERASKLEHYIIDWKDTVRGAAKKFGVSKSTVHKDVTLQNGLKCGHVWDNCAFPENIESTSTVEAIPITDDIFAPMTIRKVFLAEKNPIVKLELLIK